MIIFDSTFLIDAMKSQNNPNRKNTDKLFNEIKESGEMFATTFVNVMEMYKGVHKSRDKESTRKALNVLMDQIPVLGFSEKYYDDYGDLSTFLEMQGTPIGMFDELIAVITLHNGARIVTNNTRDFSRVPGLEIINH
ncbi:MAG: type II toxin-antitoxin system VapC family toxin [Methanogenium sp.]|nr:type II toxin-antitoxin system VapC family toxin [Methanogenium sp.]